MDTICSSKRWVWLCLYNYFSTEKMYWNQNHMFKKKQLIHAQLYTIPVLNGQHLSCQVVMAWTPSFIHSYSLKTHTHTDICVWVRTIRMIRIMICFYRSIHRRSVPYSVLFKKIRNVHTHISDICDEGLGRAADCRLYGQKCSGAWSWPQQDFSAFLWGSVPIHSVGHL